MSYYSQLCTRQLPPFSADVPPVARFNYRWQIGNSPVQTAGVTSWQPVDLWISSVDKAALPDHEDIRLSIFSNEHGRHEIDGQISKSVHAFRFILNILAGAHGLGDIMFRLVVPRDAGYILRADILSQRLLNCPFVKQVETLARPLQYYDGASVADHMVAALTPVLESSIGAIILESVTSDGPFGIDAPLAKADAELRDRLSFPWLTAEPLRRRTLVLLDGGLRSPAEGGTGETIYTAAQALGIDMIVLDHPGHWLTEPRYRDWYKSFIPFDTPMHPDTSYASRIAATVRSLPTHVDGLVTLRDQYKVAVARAAQELGLYTEPTSALEIATNKFKTSVAEGHQAFQATSFEEAAQIVQHHALRFPLVIKPCNGFLSEGVHRVEDLGQLESSIQSINTFRHGLEFVLEKYCDGPEVDANLVLVDGEMVFFEASDDFPKSADANGQGSVKTFIELANVLPSRLPDEELSLLRHHLHQSLIRMGFRNGFYHVEARVENSIMEYRTDAGVLDLYPRPPPAGDTNIATSPPTVWLIEVNPRPPGIQESEAIRHIYGLDYFALSLLFGLRDTNVKDLIPFLARPFLPRSQQCGEMIFIPISRGGIFLSDDICMELLARRPDLVPFVARYFCFLKRGDKVHDPSEGINAWVAYFIVVSREGRDKTRRLADEIRANLRFVIGDA